MLPSEPAFPSGPTQTTPSSDTLCPATTLNEFCFMTFHMVMSYFYDLISKGSIYYSSPVFLFPQDALFYRRCLTNIYLMNDRMNKDMKSIHLITSLSLYPHLLHVFYLLWNTLSSLLHPALCSKRLNQWAPLPSGF